MDDDILKEAQEAFKLCDDAEAKNRQLWLDDVKFARLGEQWPDAVRKQREAEGRPCLTINKLPAFIRQVTNDARQNKPSIKCYPVDDDASEETAEIINGLIRQIEYSSNAEVAYDTALESAVTGGFGYFRISTDYAMDDQFDQDIRIEAVTNPLNIYGDPYSTAADSSDWNVAFVTEQLKEDDFKKKYPKASLEAFDGGKEANDWFAGDKVRIAEYWTRDEIAKTLLKMSDGSVTYEDSYLKIKDIYDVSGITVIGTRPARGYKVTQRIITGAEVLETNKWAGRYIPIIPVYGDVVNVEGQRHFLSLIRSAKDSQMNFNFWRTAATELVALAPKTPFIGPKGAFNSDADKWATANTKSHAYIEYDGQMPPQRQPFAGVPAGALQEALNSADDMKSIMGIYDASLGARSNETSGRAIMARQREGDVSTFNFIDNLTRGIRHAGRVIVDLIPHVYDAPRIVRIMHEDGKNESVKINQEHQAEAPNQDGAMQGAQQGMVSPEEQKEIQEFNQGVIKLYDVTVGKYDVVCKSGPSYTTQREEAANQMMQFMQAMPQTAPIIGDLVAKNLDWPGAEEIAERMKAMLPPQVQGMNPAVQQLQQQLQLQNQQAQQAIGQLQQELQQAQQVAQSKQGDLQVKGQEVQIKGQELQLRQAELAIKQQELQIKQLEVQTKQFEAETARLEAQTNAENEQGRLQLDAYTAQTASVPVAPAEPKESQPINITIDGSRPIQKTAKAVRQPDGSYLMESIETPI